jgi:hypothetical protein
MKLEGYRQTFYEYSSKASDIARHLAFAGIALIWLFKSDAGMELPAELLWPGLLIVAALAADALHYLSASVIWRAFYRFHEIRATDEGAELTHSVWLERPITALFFVKVALVTCAYGMLVGFVWGRVGGS